MKLEIEIPDHWLERFKSVVLPPEVCGDTVEEKIAFFIETQLDYAEAARNSEKRSKLYRTFNVPDPKAVPDDDVPF